MRTHFKDTNLNLKDFNNFESMSDVALHLGTKIESALFVDNKEEITKEYSRKFRDLLVGLKNDLNTELRLHLLTGKVTPTVFVKFEKDELLPKAVLARREEQQH